jgi:hypothetical protein
MGMVIRFERLNFLIIFVGFLGTIIVSAIIGSSYGWLNSLIAIVCYLFLAGTLYIISKYISNRFLRQSHFILAAFCRAETNRFYLNHSVELRPGYLARWIEFHLHPTSTVAATVEQVLSRHPNLRTVKSILRNRKSSSEEDPRPNESQRRRGGTDTQEREARI